MSEGTSGLIIFKIDNNKTVYTFNYLPLNNENMLENSINSFNK